MTQVEMFIHN